MRLKLKDIKKTINNMPDDTDVELVVFQLHIKEKGMLPLVVTIDEEEMRLESQLKSLESQQKPKDPSHE